MVHKFFNLFEAGRFPCPYLGSNIIEYGYIVFLFCILSSLKIETWIVYENNKIWFSALYPVLEFVKCLLNMLELKNYLGKTHGRQLFNGKKKFNILGFHTGAANTGNV